MGTTPARQRGQCSFCIRALVEPSLQVRGARAFLALATRLTLGLLLMVKSCIGGIRMTYVDRLYFFDGRTASFLSEFFNFVYL